MALLSAHNLVLRFGGPPLLDDVSFDIEPGERVCLVGRNGEGKSTLLKVLAGEMGVQAGEVVRRNGIRIARLIQEIPEHCEGSVRDIVIGLGSQERQSAAESILGKTGLDADAIYDKLSGGQKRRVLIAKVLATEPDLLLLDEPTNHLDIPSIQWLEGILSRLPSAILFISHDRAFVRRLAARILEIDRGRVRSWNFPYDKFVAFRDAELENEATAAKLFDKRLANEEIWIRQGIKARRTRNEGRVRALIKMREESAARRVRTGNVNMQITEADRSGRMVARAEDVSFAYGEKKIISHFSAEISRGDRVGIVGTNGCGKTTLLRLILGELRPTEGLVRSGTNLRIAYFDQMRSSLKEDRTLLENIGDGQAWVEINGEKRHILSYLQDFLFSPERARGPISALSGGERNRLLLACLFSRPSNVLVLDEPTNDLDMETLDLLAELIAEYKGTVLVVSHDRAFLDTTVSYVLAVEGPGQVYESIGGYSDYELSRREREKREGQKAFPGSAIKEDKKTAEPGGPQKKKLSYKEQREYDALPDLIESQEARIAEIQTLLSTMEVYSNPNKLIETQKELAAAESALMAAYERYETLDLLKG
jgi:ATP-binding cassette subfamily F protein uup